MKTPDRAASNTASPEAAGDISLVDAFSTLLQHKRILALVPLGIGCMALAVSFLIKPSFTAAAQILPPQQAQGTGLAALMGGAGGALAGALGSVAGLKNPSDQWVGLLKSRVIADALLDKFKLVELYETEYRFEARKTLDENTKIIAGKDGLIDIEVTDHSAERAAQMANAYVDELQKLTNSLAVTEAAQRRLYFEKQLIAAKNNLIKAEQELRLTGVSLDVLKTNPEAAIGRIAEMQTSIAAMDVKISAMRNTMTERSPELQSALVQLRTLNEQLSTAEHTQSSKPKTQSSDYVSKYRDFKYHETLFELLARQFELAKADEGRDGALIQVVDVALVPEHKSKPKRGIIAILATLLTFIACVIYIFIRRAIRESRGSAPDANRVTALAHSP